MSIKEEDINLEKFLKFFTTTIQPESGKIQLADAEFIKIAVLFKILRQMEKNG